MFSRVDHLGEAVATLDQGGVLTPLADLVRQVYRRAADRHEPELGDDAMSFGTTVWRNLTNLGAAQFAGLPGVDAWIEDNSLEVFVGATSCGCTHCMAALARVWRQSVGRAAKSGSAGPWRTARGEQLALDDEEQFPEWAIRERLFTMGM
ncbi:hypothetical protein AB0I90_04275 [Micromonospora wenchangensis]|uniref:hypothetical protein n=1 Tax=Micromonospora wenchangensis TaxID=1185415 RepID=UPI0033E45F09